MRHVIALALVPILVATTALAAPGVTTTNVHFRSGPGENYSSIRTLPAGTALEIGDCEESGSWCAVKVAGRSGFVSGRYLEEKSGPEGWPRSYDVGNGRMVLFQPQFTEWTDFKTIDALVAAQYLKAPDANPLFGVIGLKGATSYDEDAGSIVIRDIAVTQLNFSGLARDGPEGAGPRDWQAPADRADYSARGPRDGKPRRTEADDRRGRAQGGSTANCDLDDTVDPGSNRG